jgi:hypothetical protein
MGTHYQTAELRRKRYRQNDTSWSLPDQQWRWTRMSMRGV